MHQPGAITFILLFLLYFSAGYIPAQPTNSTASLDVSEISHLHLQWFSNGSDIENVTYQLAGQDSTGFSQGALVHLSEAKVNESTPPTSTPWIALVSCDANATNASSEEDIFTLARDKGAVAALLYSLTSVACVINAEYTDPDDFDQVFDIFSTTTFTSSKLIEYQFGQIGTNASLYNSYDSQRLNDSATIMNQTIAAGNPVKPGYLFATLIAYNATVITGTANNTDSNNNSTDSSNSEQRSNTGLAMIILYVITGCVSALFCVVIISGAIRAIRHPERYGRRQGTGDVGLIQGHARGLTRAILDTFPIVKFGSSGVAPSPTSRAKDVNAAESGFAQTVEMSRVTAPTRDDGQFQGISEVILSPEGRQLHQPTDSPGDSAQLETPPAPLRRPSKRSSPGDAVMPDAIGRETCPICIVDFEEGDDLRVLPCEGRHRFHQQCVDPWLLELSSSCPICRMDFHALENMLSQGPGAESESSSTPTRANRFSRYIRSALRRRYRLNDMPDPTDPYMSRAPETTLSV